MSFSLISLITAIATLGLGLGFLFASTTMLKQWGLDNSPAAGLLSRRIGAVYLGLSLLLFLIRTTTVPEVMVAVSAGCALAVALLAVLGAVEFKAGRASSGILIAVGVETLLTLGFVSVLMK